MKMDKLLYLSFPYWATVRVFDVISCGVIICKQGKCTVTGLFSCVVVPLCINTAAPEASAERSE